MGLSQALATAMTGLRANQAGLSIVSANVANAETPGYVRKTVDQVAIASDHSSIGVRVSAIQRELDLYVQRQLRLETSGASYADLRAQFYDRLQYIFGAPGSESSLESVFNSFTASLQALTTSPDDISARVAVISAAQLLTQQLNGMTNRVQSLRSDAELGLADAVSKANEAMRQIASLNGQIAGAASSSGTVSTLLDRRDVYIDQLAQLMDINVVRGEHNQISVFTNSGMQLVSAQASVLSFDAHGTMTATAQWSPDSSERNVGTLILTSAFGGNIDLIETRAIRSGEIAALLQMRDADLVQTQNQLDAIAVALAQSLSNKTTAGMAFTNGVQDGFDIDVGSLLAGNSFDISYTLSIDGIPRTLTFVRVNDPTALPLSNSDTLNPNDKVIGIDYSGGIGSILTQVTTALLASGVVVTNPAGTTLRILDDGAGNIVNVDGVSVTRTMTSLTGSQELPFFLDGGVSYSGAITGTGSQSVGFAGRINLNAALSGDPSKLVVYQSGIEAGDGARPNFIYDRLVNASMQFQPNSGIGTASTPFSGSISTFLRQVISVQGDAAVSAKSLQQGQQIVLESLQQRFNEGASVNIDLEMANLLILQNSYAANARVMSTVKDMFELLMRM